MNFKIGDRVVFKIKDRFYTQTQSFGKIVALENSNFIVKWDNGSFTEVAPKFLMLEEEFIITKKNLELQYSQLAEDLRKKISEACKLISEVKHEYSSNSNSFFSLSDITEELSDLVGGIGWTSSSMRC